MGEFQGKNPFMDYRNRVPFIDLSGYLLNQPKITDEIPAESLQSKLFKKRFSRMINMRRMQYRVMCEEYRNGHLR